MGLLCLRLCLLPTLASNLISVAQTTLSISIGPGQGLFAQMARGCTVAFSLRRAA